MQRITKTLRCTALVQNIWIQNWTPLLKRVPALAPAFSLEKQNPISNRTKAHNLQICIIDIDLVSLFIWLQSFQPGMPINFVNPTPHILATCTISYLATWTEPNFISYLARPPWHTSSSSARQVHPRPLSPLCSASHHLLRNLEKKQHIYGQLMIGYNFTDFGDIVQIKSIPCSYCGRYYLWPVLVHGCRTGVKSAHVGFRANNCRHSFCQTLWQIKSKVRQWEFLISNKVWYNNF